MDIVSAESGKDTNLNITNFGGGSKVVFDNSGISARNEDGALLVCGVTLGSGSASITIQSVSCRAQAGNGYIVYQTGTVSNRKNAIFTFLDEDKINGAWGQITFYTDVVLTYAQVTWATYYGVNQSGLTAGVEGYAYTDSTADPLVATVTTTKAGSWLVGMFDGNGSSATVTSGTYERYDYAANNQKLALDTNGTVTIGSNSLSVDTRTGAPPTGHISALILQPLISSLPVMLLF